MRLTKFDKGLYFDEDGVNKMDGSTNKLGKLEDIEDELGIELITLFKASKNGIVFIDNDTHDIRLAYNIKIDIYENELVDITIGEEQKPMYFKFKDYGKTWALTKEELL